MGKIDDTHQSHNSGQSNVLAHHRQTDRMLSQTRFFGIGSVLTNLVVVLVAVIGFLQHDLLHQHPLLILVLVIAFAISSLTTLFVLIANYRTVGRFAPQENLQDLLLQYRRRTVEMQIAAEIARDVSAGTNRNQLLQHATSLIHSRFDFYHVALFLIESLPEGDFSVLRSADGQTPASRKLVQMGHRLPVGSKSIIGYVSATGQARVALDVRLDPYHLPNSNLPDIRAEVGVPLRIGQQVIGVLDVQSQQQDAFSPENVAVLQMLADLLAVAIHRAQLHEEVIQHSQILEERVTERTDQLATERAQLIGILDALRESVVYLQDETIIYTNRAFDDLFGYTPGEWENLPAGLVGGDQFDDKNVNRLLTGLKRHIARQGTWQGELRLQRKNGTEFDGLVTAVKMDHQGRTVDVVAIIRNISQEKALNEQKMRFVANASHELRTPLTNLQTRLYLLKRQPHRFDTHYSVLMTVIERMQRLIDDLLATSRFEHDTIELQLSAVNLCDLVREVIEAQEPEAEKKAIQIHQDLPEAALMAEVDHDRMIQIITNLVSNAVNYTSDGGSITVAAHLLNMGMVEISITDTGIGIPPDKLDQIFEPFFRADTSNNTGTGLGLSITRELVRLHGGEIEVRSQPGEGTTFTVRCNLINPQNAQTDINSETTTRS